ncbi:gap junction alpha-9 protein-like [Takifugu rubripes]|uniref:Gap junction protein n=1 Tax=Takifugu flavidus TaxID=433684 RepID=A0A5C6ND62_9TELE|nr:gap junction alpha-9 protein-like [Takifugu rubripes]XP_056875928.1 gap junction alpha-9 protein-like [Takifugu flavidus]TWW65123.1 Gap junction alpha-9 protein [Takifugu flavidus]|eukprot:XP_003968903.1 PREDICTED: gap junction alpha-9 protein-like [Takifugu rubripes]
MGDWNFLGGILEEVHIHSTMVGKIWLTILFIFRMLVLGVAAEDVWNDEQSDFICNTDQPGCRNVCYDQAFPISLIRYWVLQVIFVSSPSLVYMGHAIYQLRALEKERHCKKVALRREMEAVDVELVEVRKRIEKEMRQLEQGKLNKAPLRGSLLCTYVAHIVTRSLVEVSFMMGQYILYGHHLKPLYKCEREPCPNVVDCFVSRPTEKTVFMMFMQAIACLSLFLSLLEIIHLGFKKLKKCILNFFPHLKDDPDEFYISKSKKNSVVHQVCAGTSVAGKTTIPTAPCGYTLLMEKQGNGPNYSLLNASSAFIPIQGDPGAKSDRRKDGKEGIPSPTEQNSNSNNTSSDTHSLPVDKHEEPEEPLVTSEYPTLPVADATSCPTLSGITRKSRRISPPWNCSTLPEGNGSDSGDSYLGGNSIKQRSSCVGPRARILSKSDTKKPGRPQSPDSAGELSSASRHSNESNSPTASPPNRRVSAASSASSRRAPTDLQI